MRPTAAAPLRAYAIGAGLVAVLAGSAMASGLLPIGAGAYVALGSGGALLTGALVAVLQWRLLRDPPQYRGDARLMAGRLQAGLAVGFVAKLVGLLFGVGILLLAGLKFEPVAAFAIAFAGASLIQQVCTAALLSRSMSRCGAARS